ncbi:unnamed protein product [Acanthoscelides obtectus]|uniref:Chitin-binding type-2 domain-containing protein n=1 Tax=Acanthoscelides obtectus TaxID=200917 RepID=A0A9P0JNB0_ACAOB|nr:unnamed protein product [Acanthoscelides obtectus]CAK1628977.1 hypothetical protein AOBTE_LOCUS5497 [Acanthoscelides obtectus]
MKCVKILLFISIFGGTWRLGRPTCVLESDFGFVINCAFKKSGLFRVRNLGGVKAHIGLGFSLGDELGFKESLTNTEQDRRRSASISKAQAQLIQAQHKAKDSIKAKSRKTDHAPLDDATMQAVQAAIKRSTSTIPPFKPLPSDDTSDPAKPPVVTGNNPDSKVMVVVPNKSKASTNLSDRLLPGDPNPSNTLQAILAAQNVSEEALEMALIQRQQMMARRTSTTTTTTIRPTLRQSSSVGKVMNAPKEYYPVGYDKNFDDNFASRVELPETSFYCGDQKHFPGLYADEDLGCMVFHVCALTDDGMIMKSFLCPESTLFDQTILKCNWWFYVDCKNSKKLYDSNIPISKSYQLMKALTFFSNYKKDASSASSTPKTNGKD